MNYFIRTTNDGLGPVEAWSQQRLNYLPKDWREEFRSDLSLALRELQGGESRMLLAAFTSTQREKFDIENVLFFNLSRKWNAGCDCVERSASVAVIFERSYETPPLTPDGATFPHHHRYEIADRNSTLKHWKPGRTLAKWKGVRAGTPSSWKRAAHVWRSMRQADLEFLAEPGPRPNDFGVRLIYSGPPGTLNLLRAVKASLDGIILSFQVDDGTSERTGIEKHAAHAGLLIDETELLLRDGNRAVLGGDRLLFKNGQPNPCDDCCVAVDVRRGPESKEWLLSGEIYEAITRD